MTEPVEERQGELEPDDSPERGAEAGLTDLDPDRRERERKEAQERLRRERLVDEDPD
jgi:hypothetical protein